MNAPKMQTPGSAGADDQAFDESHQALIVRAEKDFCNLRAAFLLKGTTLSRTDRADGVVSLYATRWGMVRHLGSMDEARAFLKMIGGAL